MSTLALGAQRVRSIGRCLEWGAVPVGFVLAGLILSQTDHPAAGVLIVTVATGALVAWIVVQDLRTLTISDSAILTIAVVALAHRWSVACFLEEPTAAIAIAIGLDAFLPSGMLLLFREVYYRRRGFDGLGLGDVKLAAAGSLLVGAAGFSWALFTASLLAIVAVGVNRCRRTDTKLGKIDKVAFGALLAPAMWAVWIAEQAPILLTYADR